VGAVVHSLISCKRHADMEHGAPNSGRSMKKLYAVKIVRSGAQLRMQDSSWSHVPSLTGECCTSRFM
jgi:hypothetical protein